MLVDGTPEMLAQAKPGSRSPISTPAEQIDYPAAPGKGDGIYTVDVVFPEAGTWAYSAYDGVTGRMYEFPAVEITGPSVLEEAAGRGNEGSELRGGTFPVWPLVGGLAAFALAAGERRSPSGAGSSDRLTSEAASGRRGRVRAALSH